MSVSIFSDGNRYYWRVYRKWGNAPPHQHYIPFGEDRFASMEKAVDLDLQLQERQRAYHISLLYRADHWIRPDGKLRGVYVGVDGRGDPASNVMSGFHGRPSGCAGAALLFPAHLWMHTGQSLTCLAERSASILGRIWPKSFASAIRPMLRTLTGHWLLPLKMLGAVIRCLWKVAAVES